MAREREFKDLFPPEGDDREPRSEKTGQEGPRSRETSGGDFGGPGGRDPGAQANWTEYLPGGEGPRPASPEGFDPPEESGEGYMYMSGEQLDNDGYAIPDPLDTRDPQSARDFRPVRFRRDRRFGCLGGIMYAMFVISLSIILTCLGWMAANDVLALNKPMLTATVELPKDIFSDKVVDSKDADGNVTGKETIQAADIDQVAKILKDNGLIEYEFLFKLYAGISHADEKMDPGTYTLSTNFDYRALVTKMQAGSEAQVRTTLTFPPYFTIKQIFTRLDSNGICSYADLMNAAATVDFDYSFLKDIPLGDASRLEGFLFPDTYEFYQGMSAKDTISKFLNNFRSKLTQDMLDQCAAKGISLRDAVNIASMIEKEAGVVTDADGKVTDDRNSVASVIYNRLNAGMPLGIDSTILYSYPDWDPDQAGAPSLAELLQRDDPYNTYKIQGLPPTPICNPSLAAIEAALNPVQSSYYYYALNTATGLHEFFKTLDAFNAFVATQNYG